MKASRWLAWTGVAALSFAGLVGAPRSLKAADGVDSIQTVNLLADAKTMAVQLKNDTATLETFGQMDIKWQAHAAAVAGMREHVVAMNALVTDLAYAAANAEPWQKTVITRISPFLTTLAADNEDILDQFDAHPSLFGTPAANAYLEANVESASYLSALVVNVLENGTLRQLIQDYDEPEDACGLNGVTNLRYGVPS